MASSMSMASSPSAAARRSIGPIAGWVRRLFSHRGLEPEEGRLYWYGQHLERFLRWCRRQDPGSTLDDLRAGWLREVEQGEPRVPDWQKTQMRQGLEALVQGVENWHWEVDEAGRNEPRFRLKSSVEVAGRSPAVASERASEPAARVDVAEERPLGAGEDWRERMRRTMRVRHYAWRTEQSYLEWVGRFLVWRGNGDAAQAQTDEVRRYLEHLAVERRVSASTQNQAFSALLCFFEHVLLRPLGDLRGTLRARRGARLPVVLSREEVLRLLAASRREGLRSGG